MGYGKSSGVDVMNYTYRIYVNLIGIEEMVNDRLNWAFSMKQLQDDTLSFIIINEHLESFKRTKKWVEENHPELMS
jgi:hypothetical protein